MMQFPSMMYSDPNNIFLSGKGMQKGFQKKSAKSRIFLALSASTYKPGHLTMAF
ncbi:MAG: hypothetical protein WCE57_15375 [Salegentibacter sp.]